MFSTTFQQRRKYTDIEIFTMSHESGDIYYDRRQIRGGAI